MFNEILRNSAIISSKTKKINRQLKITNKKYVSISNHNLKGNFKLIHEVIKYIKYKGLPSLPKNFTIKNQ